MIPDEKTFVRVGTPKFPEAKLSGKTMVNFPPGDLAVVRDIPAIGTKFSTAAQGGPQGYTPLVNAPYQGTVYLHIEPTIATLVKISTQHLPERIFHFEAASSHCAATSSSAHSYKPAMSSHQTFIEPVSALPTRRTIGLVQLCPKSPPKEYSLQIKVCCATALAWRIWCTHVAKRSSIAAVRVRLVTSSGHAAYVPLRSSRSCARRPRVARRITVGLSGLPQNLREHAHRSSPHNQTSASVRAGGGSLIWMMQMPAIKSLWRAVIVFINLFKGRK